jgi:hypothetical protein
MQAAPLRARATPQHQKRYSQCPAKCWRDHIVQYCLCVASIQADRHTLWSSSSTCRTAAHASATGKHSRSDNVKLGARFQGRRTSARHKQGGISSRRGSPATATVQATWSMRRVCAHIGGPYTREDRSQASPSALTSPAKACAMAPMKAKACVEPK